GFSELPVLDQLEKFFHGSSGLGFTPKDDPLDDDGQRDNRASQQRDHDWSAFDDNADKIKHVGCSLLNLLSSKSFYYRMFQALTTLGTLAGARRKNSRLIARR